MEAQSSQATKPTWLPFNAVGSVRTLSRRRRMASDAGGELYNAIIIQSGDSPSPGTWSRLYCRAARSLSMAFLTGTDGQHAEKKPAGAGSAGRISFKSQTTDKNRPRQIPACPLAPWASATTMIRRAIAGELSLASARHRKERFRHTG
jgi:hypothetical protein